MKKGLDLQKLIALDHTSPTPLYLQIARGFEAAIFSGHFPVNSRFPTMRAIAQELGLTTSVVQRAIFELQSLGLVVGQGSSGTFVTHSSEKQNMAEERMRRYARQVREEIQRLGYDPSFIVKLLES
jgi:GntR family transcriptional regulator